jgi:hypothetical protein
VGRGAGSEIAHVEKGNFVGEIAFLTEKPATATVVTEDSVRALVSERGELNQFFRNEADARGEQGIFFGSIAKRPPPP